MDLSMNHSVSIMKQFCWSLISIGLLITFHLFCRHLYPTGTIFGCWWLSCMSVSLSNIVNTKYIQQLAAGILQAIHIPVDIRKQTTFLNIITLVIGR